MVLRTSRVVGGGDDDALSLSLCRIRNHLASLVVLCLLEDAESCLRCNCEISSRGMEVVVVEVDERLVEKVSKVRLAAEGDERESARLV